jgi:PilZ domain-containing protein
LPQQVVRRSGRIPKEIPILLIGSDLDGRMFSESTKTVLLSLHGAGVLSRHKLSPEQELLLRWPEHNKETEVRVVGNVGSHDGVHTYGVAFLDSNLNFWGLEFPPVSTLDRELGFLALVCASCKTLEKIDDTGLEADICGTSGGVVRFCKRCGSSTFWRPAGGVASQQPLVSASPQLSLFSPPGAPNPSSAPTSACGLRPEHPAEPGTTVLTLPAPEKPSRTGVERRKHQRVKVKYSACVRRPQGGDDVVLCEDMSKGGLRFKSHKQYYKGSFIEVAAPFQLGQPAIFVPAQVVFVEELPEQQLFRHGVQYLRPTKTPNGF